MPGLRIGIDVGGTFTHGVALRPPGEVVATARTPTTHREARGVATGVAVVLRELLTRLGELGYTASDVELVAHSTTQATNALLEGDVSAVTRVVIIPPGEGLLVKRALRGKSLDVGNGHHIELETQYLRWEDVGAADGQAVGAGLMPARLRRGEAVLRPPDSSEERAMHGIAPTEERPIAVIQPLAGGQELREQAAAAQSRAAGRQVVCAGDITQVLGLAARARTATVNASMLPKMLATADFTEAAVHEVLPPRADAAGMSHTVPLQVVRSDGGAMSIDEMRRQPVLSLLSGPAAGASAALHLSGLSEVVFIEVGGTSTDITLISEGRVRHRYATVGGQRLMVPALDLRTVAVGGGSMLRADKPLFGPRSAHIAGLPYLFQALADGLTVISSGFWTDPITQATYVIFNMSNGSKAAYTVTDYYLMVADPSVEDHLGLSVAPNVRRRLYSAVYDIGWELGFRLPRAFRPSKENVEQQILQLRNKLSGIAQQSDERLRYCIKSVTLAAYAYERTCELVVKEIRSLASSHNICITDSSLVAGGGGAPTVSSRITALLGYDENKNSLIPHHAVISAIGAALAVTCVSMSKSVAEPGAGEIAELVTAVEQKLAQQGAERVSTDYEYDPQRQVLTVTGRGNRPYEQSATPKSAEELARVAEGFIDSSGVKVWDGGDVQLWQAGSAGGAGPRAGRKSPVGPDSVPVSKQMAGAESRPTSMDARPTKKRLGLALDRFGRSLWLGKLAECFPAAPGQREAVLKHILDTRTQYTDGGPLLPGLALLCAGRFIPLDQLGSAELIADILRFESLPADAAGCFIIRG